MAKLNSSNSKTPSQATKILFLILTSLLLSIAAQAAAPVGQTIWIRASANGLFVSADQNLGTWAPLVANRSAVDAWEQFQVVDAGGGFIAFRSVGTGLFVSADQARAAYAPLVADRPTIGTWEQFTWSDIAGGAFTLRGRATNLFVSADQNRGAALVSDRPVANTWEQFTWAAVGSQPPAGGAPPGFPNLRWSDEFNGSSISSANWGFDLGGGGWGNNELQNYTSRPENARISNGMLVIEARRENFGGNAYTSARLKTQGKQSFGINTWVEARINAPEGQGIWPAFWMLGNSISTVGWPSCGEIDIMEIQGQNPSKNFGTIHWADANGQHVSFGGIFNSSSSLTAGFHTFAISRTSTSIKWYVDRVQYAEANISGGINSTSEFQGPFFIILNVAVGGNFVGNPDGSTVFPQQMQVDWVRVWSN
ncbi:MAG TPA: glycoside hydrolase family 16 protein [Pyrinomonadaceae bacterium]|nr:glycoside hydrolase family 16 protein [Pyrinomonadaceae bacterium]